MLLTAIVRPRTTGLRPKGRFGLFNPKQSADTRARSIGYLGREVQRPILANALFDIFSGAIIPARERKPRSAARGIVIRLAMAISAAKETEARKDCVAQGYIFNDIPALIRVANVLI